jgi:hypothetical protein
MDARVGLVAEFFRWVGLRVLLSLLSCILLLFLNWPHSTNLLPCSVISILLFISRSKLVPDFAITLHVIHLVVTSLYSHSIPRNWLWWALQITSAGMMTSLGVWSCQWRELRPINFGGSSTTLAPPGETTGGAAGSEGGDEEQGYGRGRGRGRGRDGAGEYEMVGLKPETEAG